MTCSQTRRPQIKTIQATKKSEILSKPRRRCTVPVETGRADESPGFWVCDCVRCGLRRKKSCFNCTCHEGVSHLRSSESLTSAERWTVALDVPKLRPSDKNVPQGLKPSSGSLFGTAK